MKNMKKVTTVLSRIILLAISISFLITVKVSAITITRSDHTYSSYSINMQKGEEIVVSAADIIAYLNEHESGYLNTIEKDAWFYRTQGNAIIITPLTSGAGLNVYEITNSNNFVSSARIGGTNVGCTRLTGEFEWRDKLVGTPDLVKYYPYSIGVYVHVPVTGIKILSNSVDDNVSGIKHYMYVGSKDNFYTNVLPFNSDYIVWDKVSNNAIQHIQTSSSNADIVKLSGVGSYAWGNSIFSLEGVKEGSANIKVNALYNTNASREIQVNVFKKPTYKVSDTSLELSEGVTLSDRVYATIANASSKDSFDIKWTSSNPNLLAIEKETTLNPTLITKAAGTVTLQCKITDLVAKNNNSVEPTVCTIKVVIKGEKDVTTKIITNNNSFIEQGDTIASANEGDLFFIRVEESGEEAGYSCVSSNSNICTVTKSSRSGYSYQIQKKNKGKAVITITTMSGRVISFNYVGSEAAATVNDPYANSIIKASTKPVTPVKPKIKSVKLKKNKLYITIKKSAAKYKAKGFQVKIKRNGKTIINTKWKKRKLRLSNIKKHSKYVIYIRTYNGTKKSKWTKITKKIK